MQIDLLTNCLGDQNLAGPARWAAQNRLAALEVGPSIRLDPSASQAVRHAGVEIAALVFCRDRSATVEEGSSCAPSAAPHC